MIYFVGIDLDTDWKLFANYFIRSVLCCSACGVLNTAIIQMQNLVVNQSML